MPGDEHNAKVQAEIEAKIAKRERLMLEMKTLLNDAEQENRVLNDDEEKRWDALKLEIDTFDVEVRELELSKVVNPYRPGSDYLDNSPADFFAPKRTKTTTPDDHWPGLTLNQSVDEWQRRNLANDYAIERDSGRMLDLGKFARGWYSGDWTDAEPERRAMTSSGSGGVMIPIPLYGQIIDIARSKAQVMAAGAETIPMTSATLTIPRQTADPEPGWRAELAKIKRTGAAFEPLVLESCSLAALVTVSVELFDDAPMLAVFMRDALASVIGQGIDAAALTGTGAKVDNKRIEPVGIVSTPGVQTVAVNAALDSYGPFSNAVTKVKQANGEPNGVILSPDNSGTLDALVDTTGQPLRAPASWSEIGHYDTSQIDNKTAIVGDFRQLAIGLRQQIRLEFAREGSASAEGEHAAISAFEQNAVLIRVTWRGDVAIQRPSHFCVLSGIGGAGRSKAA